MLCHLATGKWRLFAKIENSRHHGKLEERNLLEAAGIECVLVRTQAIQSIQKAMDQMNVRLHHAVSDVDGVTGVKTLEAIVAGERNPHVLAALRDKRCRKSEAEIEIREIEIRVRRLKKSADSDRLSARISRTRKTKER